MHILRLCSFRKMEFSFKYHVAMLANLLACLYHECLFVSLYSLGRLFSAITFTSLEYIQICICDDRVIIYCKSDGSREVVGEELKRI